MPLDPYDTDRDITVAIRKVANGFVLRMFRPAKPYQAQGAWESKEMVFLSLEACLEFAKKFLQSPWEIEIGS